MIHRQLVAVLTLCLVPGFNTPTPPPEKPSVGVLDFIASCRDSTAWSFTYMSSLESELTEASLTPFDPKGMDDEAFVAALDRALASSGFRAESVGTPDLHVVLVGK